MLALAEMSGPHRDSRAKRPGGFGQPGVEFQNWHGKPHPPRRTWNSMPERGPADRLAQVRQPATRAAERKQIAWPRPFEKLPDGVWKAASPLSQRTLETPGLSVLVTRRNGRSNESGESPSSFRLLKLGRG